MHRRVEGLHVLIGALCAAVCWCAPPAAGDMVVLPASAFGTRIDFNLDEIFDGPPQSVLTTSLSLFPTSEKIIEIEFDLASLPADAVIDSALLRLSPGTSSISHELYGYSGNGMLPDAAVPGPALILFDTASAPQFLDVTAFTQTLDIGAGEFAGFMVRMAPSAQGHLVGWDNITTPPQLTVAFSVVPAPGAILLAGLGLGALVLFRRRSL